MAQKTKVIDASIIVKWFSEEIGSKEALNLKDDHINRKTLLIVPELAFFEVINAPRYKKQIEDKLSKVNKDLWGLQLYIEKINPFLLEKSIELALKYNLSIYDAIYLALSNLYNSPLITADKALGKLPNTVLL